MRRASSSGRRFCWRQMPAPAMRTLPAMLGWAALPYTGQSAASCSATWRRRSAKSRGRGQSESCPARSKRCWSRPPVPSHPPGGRAGRSNSWPVNWSASPKHTSISRETVRRRLAENDLKPWRKDMWCIPHIDGEYVARMEDVLDLYAQAPDPKRPVVCFDESPTQLIGEVRQPIQAVPGQRERYDCEYRRNGTVNLFVFLDAHRPWRSVKVTDQRTARDFAECMRDLVDLHYPRA